MLIFYWLKTYFLLKPSVVLGRYTTSNFPTFPKSAGQHEEHYICLTTATKKSNIFEEIYSTKTRKHLHLHPNKNLMLGGYLSCAKIQSAINQEKISYRQYTNWSCRFLKRLQVPLVGNSLCYKHWLINSAIYLVHLTRALQSTKTNHEFGWKAIYLIMFHNISLQFGNL